MNNAERIKASQEKEKATLENAMQYGIKHLESYIVSMQPARRTSMKHPSYTKCGPGRYHQSKSRAEIRAALESQKEQQ